MRIDRVYEACKRELKYQAMGVREGSRVGPLHIPCVLAAVGVGKTSLAKQLCLDYDLPHCQINTGEASDGTDIVGVPFPAQPTDDDWMTVWAPNNLLYQATKEPVLLHFDDVDKAQPPAQNALIGLLGERKFRNTKLHPGTLILLTGNRTEDDMYAVELSESIRTRATVIILEPSAKHFADWGRETGFIHPLFRGYVLYNPDHIHVISEVGDRHTTPRGYREASDQLFQEPQSVWKEIMELKLGSAVANDIWADHEIYSKVDIDHVMKTGQPKIPPHEKDAEGKVLFDPNDPVHIRRFSYAALFAVSNALNEEKYVVSEKMTPGIKPFVEKMASELRVAFVVQLKPKVRAKISDTWEDIAAKMMDPLVL